MGILKIILITTVASIGLGFALVSYALRSGMHVPTNSELINGTKTYINAMKEPVPEKQKRKDVKASDIRKLGA